MRSNSKKTDEVFIVDDIPTNIDVLRKILEEEGYSISFALSGETALEIIPNLMPELILLDVMMPGIDGYETCLQLKQNKITRDIPVIFITANKKTEDSIVRGFQVGGRDYIMKPFRQDEVCARIRTQLQIQNLMKEKEGMILHLTIAREEAEKAKKEAENANRLKSEFLANISHELRTPMHAIMGFAGLGVMCMDTWNKKDHIENFGEIRESSERLLSLLNNLLDLSRLEANTTKFNIESSDLKNVTCRAIKSLRTLIEAKKLSVDIEEPRISTIAEFDSDKITQVIINLLSNAIKFTPENKAITVKFEEVIRFSEKNKNTSAISLSLIDQGMGIPGDELKLVFDKFVQSKKTKTGAGGTGLGLAICKQIIKAHNGKIWVENNSSSGAKFTFSLPVKQPIPQ